MTGFFFYGTLCHSPMRAAILGRHVEGNPAQLRGHIAFGAADNPALSVLSPGSGSTTGVHVPKLTEKEIARLDYFLAGFGFHSDSLEIVAADGGRLKAHVYVLPQDDPQPTDTLWNMAAWCEKWAAITVAATEDYMSHFGNRASSTVSSRFGQMLTRAGARIRAEKMRAGTCALRHRSGPGRCDPPAPFSSLQRLLRSRGT